MWSIAAWYMHFIQVVVHDSFEPGGAKQTNSQMVVSPPPLCIAFKFYTFAERNRVIAHSPMVILEVVVEKELRRMYSTQNLVTTKETGRQKNSNSLLFSSASRWLPGNGVFPETLMKARRIESTYATA